MIYGFLTVHNFINNVPNVVNSIGEISEVGATYAKSVKSYNNTDTKLSVFFNAHTDQYILDNIETLNAQAALILNGIASYVHTTGVLVDTTNALSTAVDVSVGAGIVNQIDDVVYPEWVQFTLPVVGHTVTYKVWLANSSWLTQYPKGEFEFVLPINDLQSLWDGFEENQALVRALTPLTLTQKAAIEIVPPSTGADSFTVHVYKRTDHSKHFDLPIYVSYNGGPLWNNYDNYIAAFIDILVNTGPHTLEEWKTVIPGLVALNKFYVIPIWGSKAVAALSSMDPPVAASPSIVMEAPTAIHTEFFPALADEDVLGHLVYTVMSYKSYGLYILASIDNDNSRQKFNVVYPDYFVRSVNDISANLMSNETLEMAIMLDALVRVAETWYEGDDLPIDVTTVENGIYTYLSKSAGAITLNVLTFESWLAQQ